MHFCTLFDHSYLSRGLVLYDSLMQRCPNAVLHVLCLSRQCYDYLTELSLHNMNLTLLDTLEKHDDVLLAVKHSRSIAEYIFTLSPCWPLDILKKQPEIDILTSIDADAMFFSDPSAAIINMMSKTSVGITGHHFPPRLKNLEKFGKFNVGFQSFKNDEVGLACLAWWRKHCLEWCKDCFEDNKFADQKYLDSWPILFNAKEYPDKGINTAPWNIDNYFLSFNDNNVYVDKDKLIFFHFQGLHYLQHNKWDPGLSVYGSRMTKIIRENVYTKYLMALTSHEDSIPDILKTPMHKRGHVSTHTIPFYSLHNIIRLFLLPLLLLEKIYRYNRAGRNIKIRSR